jgi:hypothetical protein
MMVKKSTVWAVAFMSLTAVLSASPNVVWAGGAEVFRQCLADAANEPNQRRSRSDCMWKNWEYMASYGR